MILFDDDIDTLKDFTPLLEERLEILAKIVISALRADAAGIVGESRSQRRWEDMITNGLFCLDRLPACALPTIVVITDANAVQCDSHILAQCLRHDVALSAIQATAKEQYSESTAFGFVPDSALLNFICRFTNGALLDSRTLRCHNADGHHDGDDGEDEKKDVARDVTGHSGGLPFESFDTFRKKKRAKRELRNLDGSPRHYPLLGFDSGAISLSHHHHHHYHHAAAALPLSRVMLAAQPTSSNIPREWYADTIDQSLRRENAVHSAILTRSSSLANQVFETPLSRMIRSPLGLTVGIKRECWSKAYTVRAPVSAVIRARTSDGFKNSQISSLARRKRTALISPSHTKKPSTCYFEGRIHMFYEWKIGVCIEYEIVAATATCLRDCDGDEELKHRWQLLYERHQRKRRIALGLDSKPSFVLSLCRSEWQLMI